MLSKNDDGVYTKEQAFCFLKTKLGIPKNSLIFKDFFKLFFYRTEGNIYFILMDEVKIDSFFEENKVIQTNHRIFKVKKHHPDLAKKLYDNALFVLKNKLSVS